MVSPERSTIFGRPDDDWTPSEVSQDGTVTALVLEAMSDREIKGRAVVDLALGVILEIDSPSWSSRFSPLDRHDERITHLRRRANLLLTAGAR